jgi:dUTPase
MSVELGIVPFNDLGRIHRPLLPDFLESLSRLVNDSSLVLGAEVHGFEVALAKYEGSRFAIGVNNGTNAIELALRAVDIKPGDEVLIPAFTFVATAFAVTAMGAIPVLVDVDSKSGLIDLDVIEKSISNKNLLLCNSVGLIDADYNKELFVSIKNTGTGVYKINPQDRIAQMMFIPIIHVDFEEVNEFSSETDRGGFGSTGND